MKFIKITKEIHGDLLAEQLGIDSEDLYLVDDVLHFKIDLEENFIKETLKTHKTPTSKEPTIQEKLERAGINIDELRIALGL